MIDDWHEYFSRFSNVSRGALLRLAVRYARLHLRQALIPTSPGDLFGPVICLTTIPSRIQHLAPTLNSLLDQTAPAAAIRLFLPGCSRREERGYELPRFLQTARSVEVVRCERDWGPATRLIPALDSAAAGAVLISVDDDTIYPPDLVETLLRWHERLPGCALAYRGWPAPASLRWADSPTIYGTTLAQPQAVDVVTGTWGALVQPSLFDAGVRDYDAYPPDAFFVDDVWFSGHLARRGVPRLVVPAGLPPLPRRVHHRNSLIDGENAGGRHNDVMLRAFAPYWRATSGQAG